MFAFPIGFMATSGPPPPQISIYPVVTGTTQVGQTLSTNNGTWLNTPTSYSYKWYHALKDGGGNVILDGNGRPLGTVISGATSSTYVLQSSDLNEYMFSEVTATNISGSVAASSDAVGLVTAVTASRRLVSTGNFRIVSTGNFRKVA